MQSQSRHRPLPFVSRVSPCLYSAGSASPGGADAVSGDKWGLGNVDKYGLPLKDKPAKAFVSTGDEIDDLLNELDDW